MDLHGDESKHTQMNEIYLLHIIKTTSMYYKNCSLFEIVQLVIKFLVLYIPLYVFVNMIFVHLYVFWHRRRSAFLAFVNGHGYYSS